MKTYEIEVTRKGKLTLRAESEEALNEILFESDDDIFDNCITRTDWELLNISDAPETKRYRVLAREVWSYSVDAVSEEEAAFLVDNEGYKHKTEMRGFEIEDIEEV
jgi:hypothetical protein